MTKISKKYISSLLSNMSVSRQAVTNESPFRIRKDLHIKEVAVPTYDLWWQCYFRNWNCNFLALAKAFTSYNLTNEHTTTRYHATTQLNST